MALASAAAASFRRYIIGLGPLFPVASHPVFIGPKGLLGCVPVGLLALPGDISVKDVARLLRSGQARRGQRLYPVVDAQSPLIGVVTRGELQKLIREHRVNDKAPKLAELVRPHPVVAYPEEPLRVVVYRMAETGLTRLPVIERTDQRKLLGMISLDDLLAARVRNLEEERRRERVRRIRLPFSRGARRPPEDESGRLASLRAAGLC